jgi:hypothetical protein
MAGGEEPLVQPLVGQPVGPVLVALPALVDHHAALELQRLRGEHREKEGHAVALQPEGELQGVAGDGLVIVGAVQPGGPVVAASDALQDVVEVALGRVLGALEHQVLQQVREPGASRRFVAGAGPKHEVDGDQRRGAVLVRDDAHPVVQLAGAAGDAQG